MGISQQIGASSIIKPGVIDNTAARPASPYEGQVIFQKDTDQLLVWNGTAWVIPNSPAQNPMGLELVKTVNVSGSSTNVTSCFSSTYNVYRIVFDSIKSNGTDAYTIQLLSNTTPATTTYSKQRFYAQSTSVGGTYVSSQSSFIAAYTGTGKEQFITMEVYDPNIAGYTRFDFQQVYTDSSTEGYMEKGTAVHATSTAYDGFSFSCGANTFTGGTIRVYGYRNS
jgi:hypothetical protein